MKWISQTTNLTNLTNLILDDDFIYPCDIFHQYYHAASWSLGREALVSISEYFYSVFTISTCFSSTISPIHIHMLPTYFPSPEKNITILLGQWNIKDSAEIYKNHFRLESELARRLTTLLFGKAEKSGLPWKGMILPYMLKMMQFSSLFLQDWSMKYKIHFHDLSNQSLTFAYFWVQLIHAYIRPLVTYACDIRLANLLFFVHKHNNYGNSSTWTNHVICLFTRQTSKKWASKRTETIELRGFIRQIAETFLLSWDELQQLDQKMIILPSWLPLCYL